MTWLRISVANTSRPVREAPLSAQIGTQTLLLWVVARAQERFFRSSGPTSIQKKGNPRAHRKPWPAQAVQALGLKKIDFLQSSHIAGGSSFTQPRS